MKEANARDVDLVIDYIKNDFDLNLQFDAGNLDYVYSRLYPNLETSMGKPTPCRGVLTDFLLERNVDPIKYVTTIWEGMYRGSEHVEGVVIDSHIKAIQMRAFVNSDIKSLRILDGGVDYISDWAFYRCEQLGSVELSDHISSLGQGVFECCRSLEHLKLSKNLEKIPVECCDGCDLRSLEVPEGVSRICGEAFYFNERLTQLLLPVSLTRLDDMSFDRCRSLETINYAGSIKQWNRIKKYTGWIDHVVTIQCTDGDTVYDPKELD